MKTFFASAIFFSAIIGLGLYLVINDFNQAHQAHQTQFEDLKSIMFKNCPDESGLSIGVIHSDNDNSIFVSCNINNWGKQIETTNGITESLLKELNE